MLMNLKIILESYKRINLLISDSNQMFGQEILQLWSLAILSLMSENIALRYVPEGDIP